jgi:hypothetical protein
MKLYCSNCGLQLKINRKALPKLGTIIDLVDQHECLEIPVDPSSIIVNAPSIDGIPKFVKSLNELASPLSAGNSEGRSLRPSRMTGTDDLRDRRVDQDPKAVSSAPLSVLDQIKSIGNSIPSHELKDDPSDSEMGN